MSDAKIRPRTELDKMKKTKFKSNFLNILMHLNYMQVKGPPILMISKFLKPR